MVINAKAGSGEAHAPAGGRGHGRRPRLVVTQLHAAFTHASSASAAKNPGVADLMPPPLAAGGLREVGELRTAEVHGGFHQLPADARDHLFTPRMK